MNDIRILRSILDSMAEAVVVADTDFKLIYFNKAAERLHGIGLSDVPPKGWGEHYGIFLTDTVTPCPPDQIPLVRVLRGEMPEHVEIYVKRPDGSGSLVEVTGRPLLDGDGKMLGGLVVFSDITARKRIETALHKSEENLQTVLDNMPAMIAYWNADLHNEFGNRAYEEWFGITPEQMRGRHIREVIGEERFRDMAANVPGIVYQYIHYPDGRASYRYVSSKIKDILGIEPEALMADPAQWFNLIHPDEKKDYLARLQKDSQELATRNWEGRLLLRDGTVKWVNSLATPRALPDGGVLWNGLMLDVTERKEMELELKRQADIDYLTGVANRGHFMKMAAQELARARRYGGALSMAMIDLDRFKHINDTYGHLVGDMVLKDLTRICRRILRDADLVGRVGGEEFAVLLPETDAGHAFEVSERLRKAIADSEVALDHGLPVHFTASIGVATFAADADTNIDILLSRADKALYKAKQSGRDKVCSA